MHYFLNCLVQNVKKRGVAWEKKTTFYFLYLESHKLKSQVDLENRFFFYFTFLNLLYWTLHPFGGGLARLGVIISKNFFRWSSVSFLTCFRNMTYMYLIAQIPQIWAPEHNIVSEIIIFFKRVPVVLWGYNNNCKD